MADLIFYKSMVKDKRDVGAKQVHNILPTKTGLYPASNFYKWEGPPLTEETHPTRENLTDYEYNFFDGLYYWHFNKADDRKIWREYYPGSENLERFHTLPVGDIVGVEQYGNSLFIVMSDSAGFTVYEWGKESADGFTTRMRLKGNKFLGIANLNNLLIITHYRPHFQNIQEENAGEVVVSRFTGNDFQKIVSTDVYSADWNEKPTFASDNDELLFTFKEYPKNNIEKKCCATYYNTSKIYRVFYEDKMQLSSVFEIPENEKIEYIKRDQKTFFFKYVGENNLYANVDLTREKYTNSYWMSNFIYVGGPTSLDGIEVNVEQFIDKEDEIHIYARTSDRQEFVKIGLITYNSLKDKTDYEMDEDKIKPDNAKDSGLIKQLILLNNLTDSTLSRKLPEGYEFQYLIKLVGKPAIISIKTQYYGNK